MDFFLDIFYHCPNLDLGPKSQKSLNFSNEYHKCLRKPISKALEREKHASIVKFSQPNLLHKPIKVHHVPLTALVVRGETHISKNLDF